MDNKALSFIMAKRLKELRESRGLSYSKLSNELTEAYHDHNNPQKEGGDCETRKTIISRDSLINYEVDEIPHSKAYANNGMSVENLRYLCDFYGVSADYLLGLTDVKTPDDGVKSILKSTHLTEEAATSLSQMDSPCSLYLMDFLLLSNPTLLERLGKQLIVYRHAKNVVEPSIQEQKDLLKGKNIYYEGVIEGVEMPRVRIQDFPDYALFDLERSFMKIVDQVTEEDNA